MRTRGILAIVVIVLCGLMAACPIDPEVPETYAVVYDGNNNTAGSVPEAQTKIQGVALTLATNSGNLARTGDTFAGWNTAADGSGTDYAEGATYTTDADLTLHAKWTPVYQVGDTGPAGGIVFYDKGDFTDGWHYLEAWTADEAGTYQWKTDNTYTGGTSTAVGSGYANTYSSMTGTEHAAAEVARNATHGDCNDWFLPSKDELNLMYENLHLQSAGGFASTWYWSSSEYVDEPEHAWGQYFGTFDQNWSSKTATYSVRAARAF